VAVNPSVNRVGLESWGIRSAMFAPLVVQERAIGCMVLADRSPRKFTAAEKRLARAMGAQVAVILANQRLIHEKDDALAMQRRLGGQREALYQISTEIYESEDVAESLQRLADAAPAVMGVDLCSVNLKVGRGNDMELKAITGNYGNCRGERWTAPGLHAGDAMRTGQIQVVEDAPHDAAVHPAYKYRLRIGSVIYVPLVAGDGEVLGLMVLIRHAPGPFSAEQLELAGVLAMRASSAIRTARLHEAALQSAKTHETLLRELHHRVKNNLASIVSLLSMNRPPMPDEARHWLDRATQRIATMSRTHELFVGGRERVEFDELVNKLLPALSLVKPPGVQVRTNLAAPGLKLDTEQAVSLAMVLNELCWNALEHGTGQSGVLEIRGRDEGEGRLVVEVEDQGSNGVGGIGTGPGPFHEDEGERGTGLRLVEGLVSRELKGRFRLSPNGRGGTVARVEIPLGE
jgi:two-component sensor histidine kinase